MSSRKTDPSKLDRNDFSQPGQVEMDQNDIVRCVDLIRSADGLLIAAGAGMGVDSGLPDFRGTNGFWRAYPALAHKGYSFRDIAAPVAFYRNPGITCGFYGHRLALYRRTNPHRGFEILLRVAQRMKEGYFVFTSNVDGHFQRAGFDEHNVVECHGSIHYFQCLARCNEDIWSADTYHPVIDEGRCLLKSAPPSAHPVSNWRGRTY